MADVITPRLVIPRRGLDPVVFQPRRACIHLTDYGQDFARELFYSQRRQRNACRKLMPIAGGSGSMSAWFAQTCLNVGNGATPPAALTPFLAFTTVVPTASSTGATITEATYTGYARTSVPNASWNAASGAAPSTASNNGTITGPACTAGNSTLIAMCTCTASTSGNVIFWCSVPSTVISSTQTPPTVAAGGFAENLT